MPIDLTQIKKKILPPQDGQDELKLRVGTVSAIDSTGLVTVTLNGVSVPGVPSLSGAAFAVGTVVQMLSYRGSLLIIGASNAGSAQPVESISGNTTSGTTTSTSFTNTLTTTGIHGVAFIAPPSGKVMFLGRASGSNANAGSGALLDYELRSGETVGSGSVVRSSSGNTAGFHSSATANAQGVLSISGLLSGLTPGAAYNVCLTYASSNGSFAASFNRRYASVYPQ